MERWEAICKRDGVVSAAARQYVVLPFTCKAVVDKKRCGSNEWVALGDFQQRAADEGAASAYECRFGHVLKQ